MARKQHRWLAVAAAALTIPAGFGIAQAVATDDGSPAADGNRTISVPRPGDDLEKLVEGVDPLKEGRRLDLSELEMGTPLSECDVALAFYQRPDVKAFSEEHFGYSLSAKTSSTVTAPTSRRSSGTTAPRRTGSSRG